MLLIAEKIKNLFTQKPILTLFLIFSYILDYAEYSIKEGLGYYNTKTILEPESESFIEIAIYFLIVSWCTTRFIKFYLCEKRIWWFDWGDIKGMLFYLGICLVMAFSFFIVDCAVTIQTAFFGENFTHTALLDKYADYIVTLVIITLLQTVILYPLSLIAKGGQTLKDCFIKLGSYRYPLIALALMVALLKPVIQHNIGDAKNFFAILQIVISFIYFVSLIAIYKIKIKD
jgi:hypothetical protein